MVVTSGGREGETSIKNVGGDSKMLKVFWGLTRVVFAFIITINYNY